MKKIEVPGIKILCDAILQLKNHEECMAFFEDICTIKELEDISQRLQVALMLHEGKNYLEICELTGASTATISRVKKCLVYGSGGYQTAIDRVTRKEEKE